MAERPDINGVLLPVGQNLPPPPITAVNGALVVGVDERFGLSSRLLSSHISVT